MPELYTRAKSRIVSLQTAIKETAYRIRSAVKETFSQILAIGYAVYFSPHIRRMFYENLIQFWEGFSRLFNPSIVSALLRSKNSRLVLKQSIPANLAMYMGIVLFYEAAIKPTLRKTFLNIRESPAEQAFDMMATLFIARTALSMFVDNTIYNLCINKASAENTQDVIVPACPCGDTAMIRAGLASPFYYLGNIITVNIISSSLPLGGYLDIPLRSLVYGQCFVEYKLGSAGLCTIHRYQELIKNNAFCFGLGLSFLITRYLCNDVVYKVAHVENNFIDDALFGFLFQHYIMLAQLLDKPLPGNRSGIDIFYHSRLVVETALKQMCDWLIPRLRHPETRGRLEKAFKEINVFPPVRLIKTILLEENLRSSSAFMRKPAVELFFDMYGETIQVAIAEIRKIRETPSIKRLQAISPYLPNFILSQASRDVLNIVLTENLDEILSGIDNFTARARIKIVIFDKARISEIHSELNQDFFRPPMQTESHSLTLSQDDFKVISKEKCKDDSVESIRPIVPLTIIENYSGMPSDNTIQRVNQRRKKKNKPSHTEINESVSHLNPNGLFHHPLTQPSSTQSQKVLQWRVRQ